MPESFFTQYWYLNSVFNHWNKWILWKPQVVLWHLIPALWNFIGGTKNICSLAPEQCKMAMKALKPAPVVFAWLFKYRTKCMQCVPGRSLGALLGSFCGGGYAPGVIIRLQDFGVHRAFSGRASDWVEYFVTGYSTWQIAQQWLHSTVWIPWAGSFPSVMCRSHPAALIPTAPVRILHSR